MWENKLKRKWIRGIYFLNSWIIEQQRCERCRAFSTQQTVSVPILLRKKYRTVLIPAWLTRNFICEVPPAVLLHRRVSGCRVVTVQQCMCQQVFSGKTCWTCVYVAHATLSHLIRVMSNNVNTQLLAINPYRWRGIHGENNIGACRFALWKCSTFSTEQKIPTTNIKLRRKDSTQLGSVHFISSGFDYGNQNMLPAVAAIPQKNVRGVS